MTTLVELNPKDHMQLKVASNSVALLASQMQIVNITAQEIPQASTEFPVFFTRNTQTGDWGASVLISFMEGFAPFVRDEQWRAIYTPNFLRTFPIFPMRSDTSDTYSLGIDPTNQMFNTESGEALYTEEGKETHYLDLVRRTIDADIKSGYQTYLMAKEFAELNLFKSIDIALQFQDGSTQNLHGLYTVDEDELLKLTQEQIHEFHQKGYFVIIHAVLISVYQINRLVRLHEGLESKDRIVSVKMVESKK